MLYLSWKRIVRSGVVNLLGFYVIEIAGQVELSALFVQKEEILSMSIFFQWKTKKQCF